MKNIILCVIFSLCLIYGCRTVDVPYPVEVVVKRDSIVTTIVKDTFFVYPPQDNKVIVKDSSYLKTDLAFSFAKIQDNGLLFHSIENFGKVPGKVVNQNTKTNTNTKTVLTVTITKTITKLRTDWIWWVGIGSMVFGVVFIAFKVKKFLSL